MKKGTMNAVVKEQCDMNSRKREVPVQVVASDGTIDINIERYDYNHNNGIISLEIWDGKLRLVVWADSSLEDPTHIINLEKAKG